MRAGGIRRAALALLVAAGAALVGSAPGAQRRFDTVILDAGHGGEDHGAIGQGGLKEKDLVLDVSRRLATKLRARGLRVIMTRETDAFVPLERRTAIANDARGDLFLSIHANASTDVRFHGTETYFLALEASDAAAAQVASRENQSFGGSGDAAVPGLDDPFIALLGDMIATEHLEESNAVARILQERIGEVTSLRSRGVKQALFVVLTGVQMPAALVEIGFVTHAGDEQVLAGAAGRGQIVGALEQAVVAYGRRYDARRGAPAKGTP